MSSPLCREGGVPNAQVEGEPAGHLPVVVQMRSVHGNEEGAELKAMVKKLVFELPDGMKLNTQKYETFHPESINVKPSLTRGIGK